MMYKAELDSLKRLVEQQQIQINQQKKKIEHTDNVILQLLGGLFDHKMQSETLEMYMNILLHGDTRYEHDLIANEPKGPMRPLFDKLEKRIELLESKMKKQLIPGNDGPLTLHEITQEIQARKTDTDVWLRGDSVNFNQWDTFESREYNSSKSDYDENWAERCHESESCANLSARESMLLHLHEGCDEGCTHEDNYNEHEGHELNYEDLGYWA